MIEALFKNIKKNIEEMIESTKVFDIFVSDF